MGSRPGGWRIGPRSPVPKSFQLRDILLELMTSDLTADDRIRRSESSSSDSGSPGCRSGQAIDRLVAEGHLYRAPGKGTTPPHPSGIGGDT